MYPKTIKVRRLVGMAEEADLPTEQEMSDEEVLAFLASNENKLTWEETEVITHFAIVENFA